MARGERSLILNMTDFWNTTEMIGDWMYNYNPPWKSSIWIRHFARDSCPISRVRERKDSGSAGGSAYSAKYKFAEHRACFTVNPRCGHILLSDCPLWNERAPPIFRCSGIARTLIRETDIEMQKSALGMRPKTHLTDPAIRNADRYRR